MSELRRIADWLVGCGYPLDWGTLEPPPVALQEAIVEIVHADPSLHGGELTRTEVAAWLRDEAGWPKPLEEEG